MLEWCQSVIKNVIYICFLTVVAHIVILSIHFYKYFLKRMSRRPNHHRNQCCPTINEILWNSFHYADVTMIEMASQITSLTIVYSTVYSDADHRKHQSSASLAFVRGIHRGRWIPRTNGQLRGICFHLMTSSCHGDVYLNISHQFVFQSFTFQITATSPRSTMS